MGVRMACCLRRSWIGQIVSHALEASCRTMAKGDSEREVASQLSHRLLHRGAAPVLLSVAADGRRGEARFMHSLVLTPSVTRYSLARH